MFRSNRSTEVDNSGSEGRKSEMLPIEYELGVDCPSPNFTNPIYQVVEELQSRYYV